MRGETSSRRHCRTPVLLGTAIAACAIALASVARADEPAKPAAPLNQLAMNHPLVNDRAGGGAAVLVGQLGDDRFEVREEATRRLSQMGIETEPALQVAVHDPDPEVRMRARRILTTILSSDLERRLNAFADDVNDSHHYDLPGWSRYRKIAGSDRVARKLFVDMQRAESNLFRELDDGSVAEQQALENRVAEHFARQISRRRYTEENMASLGTAAAILFIASDGQLTINEQLGMQLNGIITSSAAFTSAVNGGAQSKVLRQMLGAWVSRDCTNMLLSQNLWLAVQFELKEAVPTAAKALLQGNQPTNVAMPALTLIGICGDVSRMPSVEAAFKDSDMCWQDNKQTFQTQVRDIALVVAIRLRKQNPKEFGFARFDSPSSFSYYNWTMMSFKSDTERTAAMKKWKDWTAKNPLSADASMRAKKS